MKTMVYVLSFYTWTKPGLIKSELGGCILTHRVVCLMHIDDYFRGRPYEVSYRLYTYTYVRTWDAHIKVKSFGLNVAYELRKLVHRKGPHH